MACSGIAPTSLVPGFAHSFTGAGQRQRKGASARHSQHPLVASPRVSLTPSRVSLQSPFWGQHLLFNPWRREEIEARNAQCGAGSGGGSAARGSAGTRSQLRVICAAAANSTSTPHMEVPVSMHETRRLPPVLSLPDAIIALSAALSNLAASPPCFPSGVIRLEVPLPPDLNALAWLAAQRPAPSPPQPAAAAGAAAAAAAAAAASGQQSATDSVAPAVEQPPAQAAARQANLASSLSSSPAPPPDLSPRIYFSPRAPRGTRSLSAQAPSEPAPDGSSWSGIDGSGIGSVAGVGAAVMLKGEGEGFKARHWRQIRRYLSDSSPSVRFFGGIRFDAEAPTAHEWAPFGTFLFLIPLRPALPKSGPLSLLSLPHTPPTTVLEAVTAALQALSLVRPVFSTPHPPRISTQVTSKAVAPDELLWHLAVERTLQSLGHRGTQGGERDGRAGGAGDAEGEMGGEREGRGEGGVGGQSQQIQQSHQSQQSWGDKPWMLEPSRIDQMPLSKVVMARRTALTTVDPVDPVVLLGALQARDPSAFQFLLEPHAGCAFVSSTPERLFARKGLAVTSEAVAATRARAQAPAEDHSIALGLLLSNKDHEEFEIVRESVHRHLAGVCERVQVEEYKRIISQHRVQHLYARINGRLFSTAGEFNLLTSLHPTPAVAGHPQKQSQEAIRFAESFDRGLYAGPVGWFGADASEFAVGIRSALVQSGASMAPWEEQPEGMDGERKEEQGERRNKGGGGGRVLLYAGVGVVKGAKAASEWSELNLKTRQQHLCSHFLSLIPVSPYHLSVIMPSSLQFEALLGGVPVPVPGAAPGSRSSPLSIAAATNAHVTTVVAIDERSLAFHAFGYAHPCAHPWPSPGSRSSPLSIAAATNALVTTVVAIDERSLAFHALGYAMAARRPAAIITSSGTAVSNLLPAVVEASQQHVPLLVLTADRPAELRDTAANQTIDQVHHFGTFVRYQADVPAPSDKVPARFVLTTIDTAAFRACAEPPGPVHLNWQFREPLAPSPQPWSRTCLAGLHRWQTSVQPFSQPLGVTTAGAAVSAAVEADSFVASLPASSLRRLGLPASLSAGVAAGAAMGAGAEGMGTGMGNTAAGMGIHRDTGIGNSMGSTSMVTLSAEFQDVLSLLRSAKRGIILVGSLLSARDAWAASLVCKCLQWPVAADALSGLRVWRTRRGSGGGGRGREQGDRGGVGERGVAASGCGGESGMVGAFYLDHVLLDKGAAEAVAPDVVLQLGGPLVGKRLPGMVEAAATAPPSSSSSHPFRAYILVNPSPRRIDPAHAVSHRLHMPLPAFASALATALPFMGRAGSVGGGGGGGGGDGEWGGEGERDGVVEEGMGHAALVEFLSDAVGVDKRVGKELSLALNFPSQVPDEAWVARTVAACLPDGHALFLGNSMPIRDIDMYAAAPSSSSPFSAPHRAHPPVAAASTAGAAAGSGAIAADGAAAAERLLGTWEEGGGERVWGGVRVAGNRGASGIDGVVSTAVGFAAGIQQPVSLLIGDVSFLHDSNSLALLSAARRIVCDAFLLLLLSARVVLIHPSFHPILIPFLPSTHQTHPSPVPLAPPRIRSGQPPVTVVVVNNGGGGIFSLLPVAGMLDSHVFSELFSTPHQVQLHHLCKAHRQRGDLGSDLFSTPHQVQLHHLCKAHRSEGTADVLSYQTVRQDRTVTHAVVEVQVPPIHLNVLSHRLLQAAARTTAAAGSAAPPRSPSRRSKARKKCVQFVSPVSDPPLPVPPSPLPAPSAPPPPRVAYFRATTRTSLLSSLQAAWATHRHAVVEVQVPPIHLNVLSHRLLQAAARATAARALSLFQSQRDGRAGLEGERGGGEEGIGVVLREPPTSVAVAGAALPQSEREGLLLHVRLEGGALGTGEVSPLPGLHPESFLDAHEQLCLLSHRLPGLALPLSLPLLNGSFSLWIWHDLGIQPASLYSSVRAGLEAACLSAIASAHNTSLSHLLSQSPAPPPATNTPAPPPPPSMLLPPPRKQPPGLTHRVRVRCCGLLDGSRGSIPSVSRAAAHLVHSLGFTALKIKVARRASPSEDAAMVLAVREAVGPRIHLRVDANRSWSLPQAVEFGRLVASCNLAFIEEPVSNLHLLSEFYQATGLPFALDESLDDALLLPPSHDTPTLALPASLDWSGLAAVVVKPSRLGGMEAAAVAARWAALLGAECIVSSSFESRHGLALLCHFAAFLDTHPFPSPQPSQAQDSGSSSPPESPPASPTAVVHGLGTFQWLVDGSGREEEGEEADEEGEAEGKGKEVEWGEQRSAYAEGLDRVSRSPPLLIDERSSDGQLGVLLSARSGVGGASGMLTCGVHGTSDSAAVVGTERERAASRDQEATIRKEAESTAEGAAELAAQLAAAASPKWEERRETVTLSNGGTVDFNILVTPSSSHSSSPHSSPDSPLSSSRSSLPPATPPPTLVFLHGFLGTLADWLPLADSLSLSFPCALVDLPGHGSTTVALPAHPTISEPPSSATGPAHSSTLASSASSHSSPLPPALSFEETASAIASLLAQLQETAAAHQQQQQQGKVVLVGYSMGARLALYLALRNPHLVSSAVIISGSPGIREAAARAARAESDDSLAAVLTAGGLEQYVHSWYQQPLWASLRTHPCFQPMLARRFASSPSASHTSPRTDGTGPPMVVFPGGTEAGLAMALRGLSTGRQPSLWDELTTSSTPLLLVAGSLDSKFVSIAHQMSTATAAPATAAAAAAAAAAASSSGRASTLQQEQEDREQQEQEEEEQELFFPAGSPVESRDSDFPFSLNLPSVAAFKSAILGGQAWEEEEEQQYEGNVVGEGDEFEEEIGVNGSVGGSGGGDGGGKRRSSRFDGAWAADMKRVHLEESLGAAPDLSTNDKSLGLPIEAAKAVLITGGAVSVAIVDVAGHAIHEERPEALLPLIRLFASNVGSQAGAE
ncbi:unnamed protein product [Closterium sp. Naga37s-1]|nr:unnamed protein product [Closterium sp. Naga37s-1]